MPDFSTQTFFFGLAVIAYGIFRYGLLSLTPELASKSIMSSLPDLLFLLNREGKIVTVSDNTLEALGYTGDELDGQPLDTLLELINPLLLYLLLCHT